ncbi:MAG: hypothetical protein QOK23_2824 [Gammaproteobacteria bacterium]|jgi:hypothetical protein|nr:hypothetical protein [Gammaproteobacteria bacterium]
MNRKGMNGKWRFAVVSTLALASTIFWGQVFADVTIQQETTIHAFIVKAHGTTIDRVAGDKQRNETQFSCDGVMSLFCGHNKTVDIVRLDRGVTWKVEPKQKRYTEFPIPTPEQRRAELAYQQAVIDKLKSCPQPARTTVDTSKCEMSPPVFAVNKTSDETTLIGHKAHRTNVSLTQSCKVKDSTDVCNMIYSFDVWLTQEELPGLTDRTTFASAYQKKIGGSGAPIDTAQLNPMLAPYEDSLRQLKAKSADFKGYPLKTTFRFAIGGAHCGLVPANGAPQSGGDSTLSTAGTAAGEAGANSASTAAGWGAEEAAQKASGNSLGGYVAGSAAGAFTKNLVGGLFSKKKKVDPAASDAAPAGANAHPTSGEPATTVAEISIETTAIDPAPVTADQFEVPAGWKRLEPKQAASEAMPSCPST